LFTVCPKCTLTLVVTTVDLRAGQGYVRCGRCANVFNALIALREGDPSGGPISDSARLRAMETPPKAPVEPAMGAGVAIDPEPEPEPAPVTEPEPTPEPEQAAAPEEPPAYDLSFEAAVEEVSAEEIHVEETPTDQQILESPPPSEDASMEFDATATDVSEIFISPSDEEHDSGSGNYEAVVLQVEPPPEALLPEEEDTAAPETGDADPHTDTIAAEDWSLLDDEEPQADAESVIEESPLPAQADDESAGETGDADPPWVQEMFAEAEAEAEAKRTRTGERRAVAPAPEAEDFAEATDDGTPDESPEEPAALRAARDVKGVSAASGDTVLEPLLAPAKPARAAWPHVAGVVALVLALILQVLHHNRQRLVLNPSVGPMVSTVYGWFGATLTPLWDLTAYTVKQLGAEAEGSEGSRLRVRLSVQNDSDRVQPLPLLRLTLQDRFGQAVATRDLEPREYLPARAGELRLLEPDQRIDAELHVIDPGKAAIGFEIDACLRSESGTIGCANDARRRATG